jgi:hypothetical protein
VPQGDPQLAQHALDICKDGMQSPPMPARH